MRLRYPADTLVVGAAPAVPIRPPVGQDMALVSTLPLMFAYRELGIRFNASWSLFPSPEATYSATISSGQLSTDSSDGHPSTTVETSTAQSLLVAGNSSATLVGPTAMFNVSKDGPMDDDMLVMTFTALVLGIVILTTVIGNVFVIAAILMERNLQSVANYLILSLAFADLLVACLVMPLGAVYEVSKQWTLGTELCDMWTCSDVLCCTASILHLVAIAVDRYWAVTNIDYIHHRNGRRIGGMIAIIWSVSFLISMAPMMGWKDPDWEMRVTVEKACLVSQDLGYQIFATMSSFYVPLAVILVLYYRIFQTARKRIRRKGVTTYRHRIGRPLATMSETTCTTFATVSSSDNPSPEKTSSCTNGTSPLHETPRRKLKDSLDSKRERKAAKTLAIITGVFVICWLPFFIMALLMPLCPSCYFNDYMMAFFLWLGYFNSTLNPVIYTIFSPEFRIAFQKLLCGRNRKRGLRRRAKSNTSRKYMV